jgi:hypothetical protein
MNRFILSILAVLAPLQLLGQMFPLSDNYVYDAIVINPAFAGISGLDLMMLQKARYCPYIHRLIMTGLVWDCWLRKTVLVYLKRPVLLVIMHTGWN